MRFGVPLALAATAALSLFPPAPEERWAADPVRAPAAAVARVTVCPPDTLADLDVCIHLSREEEGMDELTPVAQGHFDKRGHFTTYEQIPRRPERPSNYDAYVYPVPPGLPNGHFVVSGYDLDRPDSEQRRGRKLHAVGHGGVDLPQAKGTKIELIALEHQEGDAEVVFVGWLFGNTVITRHTVREGGARRDYLLLFGHLEETAPGIVRGAVLHERDAIGTVGDSGSPELVHLHLEARRVQEGVDVMKTKDGATLLDANVSTVCDPRNVLPLR